MDQRLFFCTMILVLIFVEFGGGCRLVDSRHAITYRLIKENARSMGSVMTRRHVVSVAKCRDFAEHKSALAFNYERKTSDSGEANCMLLRCPETSGLRQLVNVTGVDYYSAYAGNVTSGNTTLSCIENVGLFILFPDKLNYTNARAACEKIHGSLADTTSEPRTRGLATLIGKLTVYVGLSNEGNKWIWKNEFGEPLFCSDYRAWDTGEPSHNRGCVELFQMDRKTNPVWRVVSCSTELPYICELPRAQGQTQELQKFFFNLMIRRHRHRKG